MSNVNKISGAAICFEKIDACNDDQIVTIPWLRAEFKKMVSDAAAYNVIWRLRAIGALTPVPGDAFASTINRKKFKKFLDAHTPRSPYFATRNNNQRGGLTGKRVNTTDHKTLMKMRERIPMHESEDIDVINTLLDAMAAAEPILNKMKAIYEAVHS